MHLPDSTALANAIENVARQIAERHARTPRLALVGIANGGIPFAARLKDRIAANFAGTIHLGTVDIAFYRDDFERNPIPKVTEPSSFGFAMDDAVIVLCDDVIHSGRTIRAAMNDLFDQGRPQKVELAVLCDRGGRVLPIQPDYTGMVLDVQRNGKVRVRLDATDPARDSLLIA